MRPHKLFYPFGVVYGLVVRIRNIFYDKGWFRSETSPVFSICVGNISVGGTGKTPMIEYLIKLLLKESKNIAVLSRGYKRKTKGFLKLGPHVSAIDAGDEPFQIFNKFKEVKVFVDEDRVEGVKLILELYPHTDVILLDDAFQHRSLEAQLNIVLTRYDQLYTDDYYLPAGYLRDHKSRVKQAEVVVITKSPGGIDEKTKNVISDKLKLRPKQLLFFTGLKYDSPKPLFDKDISKHFDSFNYLAITGIAYPKAFIQQVERLYNTIDHIAYPDHYTFKRSDIFNWLNKLSSRENPAIITTEKDAVRLLSFETELQGINVFYIPIEVEFQGNEQDFRRLIVGFDY